MHFRNTIAAALMLASTSTFALDVFVGGIPMQDLEANGWKRVDGTTVEFVGMNGTGVKIVEGDGPLLDRIDELLSKKRGLTAAEQLELSELQGELEVSAYSKVDEEVAHCYGHLNFTPSFSFWMSGGSVNSTLTWSEFGPYSPYSKTITARAVASASGLVTQQQSMSSGSFVAASSKTVYANAAIYPTFSPNLTASATFYGQNCPRYTFYQNQRF